MYVLDVRKRTVEIPAMRLVVKAEKINRHSVYLGDVRPVIAIARYSPTSIEEFSQRCTEDYPALNPWDDFRGQIDIFDGNRENVRRRLERLPNEWMKTLAKAFGLNPNKFCFEDLEKRLYEPNYSDVKNGWLTVSKSKCCGVECKSVVGIDLDDKVLVIDAPSRGISPVNRNLGGHREVHKSRLSRQEGRIEMSDRTYTFSYNFNNPDWTIQDRTKS